MGLFSKKRQESLDLGLGSIEAEIAVAERVLLNYPPGHRLRPGERCLCPECGELGFVTMGNRTSKSTVHTCASCHARWELTERALDALAQREAESTTALLAAAAGKNGGKPLQVLLVEDDPADAALVQAILAPAIPDAVQLVTVDTRHEADEMAHLGFDVILLDLNLSDSRGVATAERFTAAHPEAHVCVCTGDESLAGHTNVLGLPVLHKDRLVELIDRRHQGTAELLTVLHDTAV